jgi:hypothetical protein
VIPSGRTPLGTRIKTWWIEALDNDSVRPWVPMYYYPWLAWAILATFWLPPVSIIEEGMGSVIYMAWVVLAIPGTIGPIMGLRMRHGGSTIQSMSILLLLRDWMGLIFQAGGHAISCILLVMFEIAACMGAWNYVGPRPYAGLTIFAAVMLLPWTTGTAILCAQCLRKIQRGLQLERGARS